LALAVPSLGAYCSAVRPWGIEVKKLALGLGVAVLVLAGVVIGRSLPPASRQVQVEPAPAPAIDADDVAAALAEAIRFRTVSNQDPARFDAGQFAGLQAFLARRYPRVHQALTREVVNDYSLLYTWPGRGTGKPIVLLAHLDVVPVEAGTEAAWTHPPFSGAIADGYIWGRGALDDKSSALGILEAVEYLLGSGFQPARTVYLAFGHDEEVSGHRGAAVLSARLRERRVEADFVLDEGGSILDGMIPGVGAPVATVCVGEKGYVTVELTATGPGGHSSMPPPHTPIGVLSAAIEKLERAQMPAHVGVAMNEAVAFLGPEMPFSERVVFANLWLFGPLVAHEMAQRPQTNALIRTTTAPTIFDGGVKENILPAAARAVVNFRILPGDTVATVVEHVRRTIDDPTIAVHEFAGANDPTSLSTPEAPAFASIARTIRATFPGTLVIPFVTLGATDARYYSALSANVYRFLPTRMRAEDLARVHGTNERIAIADYVGMIRFYVELLRGVPEQ
jgi:carboxypeptidase PM20D1